MALKPRRVNVVTSTTGRKNQERKEKSSESKEVIKRINIKPKLDFYRNSIYEYDITSAGFSILKKSGFLTQDEIEFLECETKYNRNVYIGNLMKDDKKIVEYVESGLLNALNQFLTVNDIKKTEILTAKRDSLFVLKKASILQVKNDINFRLSSKYSGFFGFREGIEIYYSFNLSNKIDTMKVKGLSIDKIEDHKSGILQLVKFLLEAIQNTTDSSKLLPVFDSIKKNYLDLKYSTDHYRELNRKSFFRLKEMMLEKNFIVKNISEDNKEKLDILYNYKNVLLPVMASAFN